MQGFCKRAVFPEPVPLFAVWRENQLNEAKIALAELEKGHASIVLTLDTYSHVLPTMQQDATEKLEMLLKTG